MRIHSILRTRIPIAVAAVLAAGCTSMLGGGDGPGSVSGRVVEPNGTPVLNAVVRASNGRGTTTDHNGEFRLTGLRPARRTQVSVSAPDFAGTSTIVPVLAGQDTRREAIILIPQGAPVSFDPRSDATLSFAVGGGVRIPANALRRANGQPAVGMVTARMAVIDPRDPWQLLGGPGELAIGSGAQRRPLVSGGMVRVQLTDAGGEMVDLAPGQRAEVRFPANMVSRTEWPTTGGRDQATRVRPDTMPATAIYLFNLDTGAWEWVDTVTATPGNFISGWTPSLGPWINLDKPDVRTCIHLQVLQSGGAPAPNAYVAAFGMDYNGYSGAYTDATGRAQLLVRQSSSVLLASGGKQMTVNTPGVETPCLNAGTL